MLYYSKKFAQFFAIGFAVFVFGCNEQKTNSVSHDDGSSATSAVPTKPASKPTSVKKPKHVLVVLSEPNCKIKQVMFAGKMVPKLYWSVKYRFDDMIMKKQDNYWYHCNINFVGTKKSDRNRNYQGRTIADSGVLKGENYMHTIGKATELQFEFYQSGSKTGSRTLIAEVVSCPVDWPAE